MWIRAVALVAVAALAGTAVGGKSKFNAVLAPGDKAPAWEGLMGMDGNVNALEDFDGAKAVVLIFTCNRCPVAKAYEDRLIDFTKAYQHGRKQKDVYVVAINVSRHPADSFEKMVARSGEKKYPFAYVHDPSQSVGKAYGVNVSVQAFVLDQERRIVYLGAFDDNTDPAKVTKHYVKDAVDAVLAGKTPAVAESLPRGCPVDYGEASNSTDE